jgi:hypothetical protein
MLQRNNDPRSLQQAFQSWLAYPLQQLAVMIPATMKFSSRSSIFEILATGNSRYQVSGSQAIEGGGRARV